MFEVNGEQINLVITDPASPKFPNSIYKFAKDGVVVCFSLAD